MKDVPFRRAQTHMTCQSDHVVSMGKVQFSWTQILLRHHDLPRAPVRVACDEVSVSTPDSLSLPSAVYFRVLPKHDDLSPTHAERLFRICMQGAPNAVRVHTIDVSASSVRLHEDVLHLEKSVEDRVDVDLDGVWRQTRWCYCHCREGRVRLGAFLI
jgi:hypothetical protein